MKRTWDSPHPFGVHARPLPAQVADALDWCSSRPPEQRVAAREATIRHIERHAAALKNSGEVESWFRGADEIMRAVSDGVNGPLLEHLAKESGFHDLEAVSLFRCGAPMTGKLPVTGNGDTIDVHEEAQSRDELLCDCRTANMRLIRQLHKDEHSSDLLKQIEDDASNQQRMTAPVPICERVLEQGVVSRRFSRVQGTRPDGSLKVRAVDDCTGSGLNATTAPGEKLHHHHLDQLLAVAAAVRATDMEIPMLWKADIDAAYRRIPVMPEDRELLHVAVLHEGVTMVARHHAAPFGAVASVHAWERCGALLWHIACAILHLPVLRYVDDFFSAESPTCCKHSMHVFARLITAVLGSTAISKHKLEWGNPLTILGLTLTLRSDDIMCAPDRKKAEKWAGVLKNVINDNVMAPGDASKMAGRLSFASQHMFLKLGRAMLRPFFAQQYAPPKGQKAGGDLITACKWWIEVLERHRHQTCPWNPCDFEVVEILCDARGDPPRIAAVLASSAREIMHTDMETPPQFMRALSPRGESQIMGQEMLAVLLALTVFQQHIAGKVARVWTDNVGGEGALRRGSARQADHNRISLAVWSHAAQVPCGLWFERVPSEANIADLPSREDYVLLRRLGAQCVAPGLHL